MHFQMRDEGDMREKADTSKTADFISFEEK